MNRPVPRAGITFAHCLHERSACSACGTSATVADWPHRGVHARTSRFDLHACGRRHDCVARIAGTGSGAARSLVGRADLLGDARESLTGQSVPPGRSTIERGLCWYDNQHVLAKLFGGWKRHPPGGRRLPRRSRLQVRRRVRSAAHRSADPDPGSRTASISRRAPRYSTRGYARFSARLNARNLGGAPVDIGAFGQYYEYPQEDFFGLGMRQPRVRTHQLPARRRRKRRRRSLEALRSWSSAAARRYLSPRVGRGTDSRFPSIEDLFTAATTPGLGTQHRLHEGGAVGRVRLARQPVAPSRRRPLRSQRRAVRRSRPRPVRLSPSRRESAAVRAAGEPLSRARPASGGRLHRRRQRPAVPVLSAAHARRRHTPARISRVSLSRPEQPAARRRVPMGGLVGARRRAVRRRRHGGTLPPRSVTGATWKSATASDFASTATVRSWLASTWHSAGKALFRF